MPPFPDCGRMRNDERLIQLKVTVEDYNARLGSPLGAFLEYPSTTDLSVIDVRR